MIVVSDFFYPSPGPDAFFWAGEDSPGCDENSIENSSYNMAPGKLASKSYISIFSPRGKGFGGVDIYSLR